MPHLVLCGDDIPSSSPLDNLFCFAACIAALVVAAGVGVALDNLLTIPGTEQDSRETYKPDRPTAFMMDTLW